MERISKMKLKKIKSRINPGKRRKLKTEIKLIVLQKALKSQEVRARTRIQQAHRKALKREKERFFLNLKRKILMQQSLRIKTLMLKDARTGEKTREQI